MSCNTAVHYTQAKFFAIMNVLSNNRPISLSKTLLHGQPVTHGRLLSPCQKKVPGVREDFWLCRVNMTHGGLEPPASTPHSLYQRNPPKAKGLSIIFTTAVRPGRNKKLYCTCSVARTNVTERTKKQDAP